MAGCPSKFFLPYLKKMLNSVNPIYKSIHKVTGKIIPMGSKIEKRPAGKVENPTFRKVGK